MTIITLRPNEWGGGDVNYATGGSIAGGVISDSSDSTYVLVGASPPNFPCTTYNLNGAAVKSVRPYIRGRAHDGTYKDCVFDCNWPLFNNTPAKSHRLTGTTTTVAGNIRNASLTQGQLDDIKIYVFAELGGNFNLRLTEAYIDVEIVAKPVTVINVVSPDPVTASNAVPVSWVNTLASNGGGQTHRQIKVFSAAQYGAGGFNPTTSTPVWDSGEVSTSSTSATTAALPSGITYRAYLRVAQTVSGARHWSDWSFDTFEVNVPPTGVLPANLSIATTPRPSLGANGPVASAEPTKRQWQIASNSGFTTDVQLIDEGVYRTTHSSAFAFPLAATPLVQGVWYIRSRFFTVATGGHAWSATQSFTVSHPPTATPSFYSGGSNYAYPGTSITLPWVFADPWSGDAQTGYEVELWKSSDKAGSLILDSAVTADHFASLSGLDATWKGILLRWRVRATDVDAVLGPWSSDTPFVLRDAPVVVINNPSTDTIIGSSPTFEWSTVLSPGTTQVSVRAVVTDLDNGGAVVADSGLMTAGQSNWTPSTPILILDVNYRFTVTVVDSAGIHRTEFVDFQADFDSPTPPDFTVDGSQFSNLARISIDWSDSTVDEMNVGWRVYRRELGAQSWTLAYEGTSMTTYDFLAPANVAIQYVVVQVSDDTFGGFAESSYEPMIFDGTGMAGDYWLIAPSNPGLNMKLHHVTSDDFEEEEETATLNILGRGRRIERGGSYGKQGSLSAELHDTPEMTARQQRQWVEALRASGLEVYLRTPFGEVWSVSLMSAAIARKPGVGLRSDATLTLSYSEVTA